MANQYGKDLRGVVIVLTNKEYAKHPDQLSRWFKCSSGEGCCPDNDGTEIHGRFMYDGKRMTAFGKRATITASDIEQVAV